MSDILSKFTTHYQKILGLALTYAQGVGRDTLNWDSDEPLLSRDGPIENYIKGNFLEKQKFMSSVDEKVKEKTRSLKKKVKLN